MSKLKELREARAKNHADLSAVLQGPDNAESREKAKKLIAAMDAQKVEIDAIESRGHSLIGTGKDGDDEVEFRRAFTNLIRKGESRLKPEERELLEKRYVAEGSVSLSGQSSLGYFVPTGFQHDLEQALKYYAPFLNGSAFTVIDTAIGNLLPWPTNNDTTNEAVLVGENAQVNEEDVTASSINLSAWKFSSGVVRASLEIVQDSAFPLESWLAETFAIRFGRAFESYLTTGTGSSQPTGILTAIEACGVSPIIAVGSAANTGNADSASTTIGTTDIINLEHGVDPAYRRRASYMMNDTTLGLIKRLLDKFGRPIWQASLAVGEPDTLNGYPVVINQQMPNATAGLNPIIFGDLKKYVVRRVRDFQMMVLRERYADQGQTGYLGFMRIDGNLIDAGTHPCNILEMHS
jgi:HK97 family phage major capsid protein